VTVSPGTATATNLAQGRVEVSALGTQASLPEVHRLPPCTTAVRKRSSLVAIDPGAPGWSAEAGVEVAAIPGSFSVHPTLFWSGVPVTVSIPALAPLQRKQPLLL
jgi:hypothetical protein